jgi:hypothetical protein
MMKNRNFQIADEVYRDLKHFCVDQDITLGGGIRRLLEIAAGKPNFRCAAYRTWLQKTIAAGDAGGPEAAEEFMRQHPYTG